MGKSGARRGIEESGPGIQVMVGERTLEIRPCSWITHQTDGTAFDQGGALSLPDPAGAELFALLRRKEAHAPYHITTDLGRQQ